MSLPGFSARRPVLTTMVTLIVVTIGAVSLSRLRTDLLPEVKLATLSIRTNYEGASPEVMERMVTQIIEEIVATVPGVEELTSQSSEGRSDVRVRFGWGTDIDTAAIEVQSRLEQEMNELPEDIERPQVRKFDVNSFPVVLLGISSELDPVELTTLVEDQIRYRFSRVPGVAQVDLWGGYNREVRVELDPQKLRALDLPLNQVLSALRNANLDLPAGRIESGRYEVTLRAPAQYKDTDELRHTVVAVRRGAPVTISQIAEVTDTYEKITRHVRVNGKLGIRVAIRKQADANTVEVARAVLAEIDEANAAFPQIHIVPVINQGNFIERSIQNVANSVLYGGALAVLVLLFFLRNLRSTLVIALAIPICIIATFALVYLGGLTLNLMTLGGLALGVGMMVDNSIVVLENIFRRRDEVHESKQAAAIHGADEVAGAIIASTITTLVIFLPLVFVEGVTGLLFKDLAYVIMFALFCSLVVALSLLPMLASKLVESPQELHEKHLSQANWIGKVSDAAEAGFQHLESNYRGLLDWVMRHRWLTISASVIALGASLLLYPLIGSEFMPPSDEGEVRIEGEMEVGTRLDLVNDQMKVVEEIVKQNVPEMTASVVSVRAGDAELNVSLGPARQRARSNAQVAEDLRRQLNGKIPGMIVRTRAPQGQFLLERLLGTEETLNVEVRGYELDVLDALAERVIHRIDDIPGITDVDLSRDTGIPEERITIDRQKAADLGLNVRDVAAALQTAIAGSQAGEFHTGSQSYRILVQLKDAERLSLDEVLDLTLSTPTGEQVAMRNLVTTRSGFGPMVIDRKDQQRIVTVKANVSGRDMGSVARDVTARLSQIARPVGYDMNVAGNFEEQQKATHELTLSIVMSLALVYMVLACQYESLRDPLVVMCSVPLAAIGVLVTLFLTDTTLNVQSYIGCIMLGGIVVNNAILLVDQAGQLRRHEQYTTHDAVTEAGRRRLRPILMTTLTTILGLSPLALGIGEGADAQAPLARAVIGGLLASTLITLVLIPAVYSLAHPQHRETTA